MKVVGVGRGAGGLNQHTSSFQSKSSWCLLPLGFDKQPLSHVVGHENLLNSRFRVRKQRGNEGPIAGIVETRFRMVDGSSISPKGDKRRVIQGFSLSIDHVKRDIDIASALMRAMFAQRSPFATG
mgnify:CR=1 FL=1